MPDLYSVLRVCLQGTHGQPRWLERKITGDFSQAEKILGQDQAFGQVV